MGLKKPNGVITIFDKIEKCQIKIVIMDSNLGSIERFFKFNRSISLTLLPQTEIVAARG